MTPPRARGDGRGEDRRWFPLFELVRSRVLEFLREPEAVFWVYGFPVVMVLALGLAFRAQPQPDSRVAVVEPPSAPDAEGSATTATGGPRPAIPLGSADGLVVEERPRDVALERLRTGRIDLVVEGLPSGVRFHLDESRPESVLARSRVRDLLERAAGRTDRLDVESRALTEPGSRYVDFLVPGLMGLSLLGGGLWGVGFATVEMRMRKLLKRFLATPMRRGEFLLAMMLSRMAFMIPEMLIVLACARWLFDVRIFGSPLALAFLVILGATSNAGLGLLLASRAKSMETVSGILNLVMLPMWLGSGVFFPRDRYPEWLVPLLDLLPLSPLVDALRGVMLEGLPLTALWPQVATVAAWGIVSFAIALRIFRWM
jgi:ABC-2 type transport system permease protein